MQPFAQALHVGELLVHGNSAIGIALWCLPGIINIDIGISIIGKTFLQQSLGTADHLLLCDTQAPAVPTVPSHGRCERYLAAYTKGEPLGCLSVGIACLDGKGITSSLVYLSAQRTILSIQGKSRRKVLCAEGNRLLATDTETEDDRRTRANTIEVGGIEPGSVGGGRRKDILVYRFCADAASALLLCKGCHQFHTSALVHSYLVVERLLVVYRVFLTLCGQYLTVVRIHLLESECAR